MQAQWEAQNVVPQHYKNDLLALLRTYLNDPTHVRDASVSPPLRKTVGPGERYVACVRYNARDSKAGQISPAANNRCGDLRYSRKTRPLPRLGRTTSADPTLCKDAAYAPFPEVGKSCKR